MAKRDIFHANNPGYWDKNGRRIPGVNTNFDVAQPKNYYIDIKDKVVITKLTVIARKIHKFLDEGKSLEDIANELISSKVYGEFITKFQISYNQYHQTKWNRYEIIKVIYKNYQDKTVSQQEKKSVTGKMLDGPEDPEN